VIFSICSLFGNKSTGVISPISKYGLNNFKSLANVAGEQLTYPIFLGLNLIIYSMIMIMNRHLEIMMKRKLLMD